MISVNLIPPDRLAGKTIRGHLRIWSAVGTVYLLVLVAALGACYAAWGRNDNVGLAKQLASTQLQIDETAAAMSEMTAQLSKAKEALATVETVADQPDWSILLALLAKQTGKDVVLQACQVAPEKGPSGIGDPSGENSTSEGATYRLALVGFGQTQQAVSRFLLELDRVEVFDEVRLVKSNRQPFLEGQAVAFRIECNL